MVDTEESVVWYQNKVTRNEREIIKSQKGFCLWFTGLSGSGKSTIASAVERELFQRGHHTYLLDGDNIRRELNNDLGFRENDRIENIRRVGEVAKLFIDSGLIVLVAVISPYRAERKRVRNMVGEGDFIEIFVDCPLDECIRRDPKGLYKKAIANEISDFTGISSPYETPENSEITILNSGNNSISNIQVILNFLTQNNYIK